MTGCCSKVETSTTVFGEIEIHETITSVALKVEVFGTRRRDDDWMSMLGHLCRQADNDHVRKNLLVDLRGIVHSRDVSTDYSEAKALINLGFARLHKIAVLDIAENRVPNEFMEDTADNRGITIRFFYTNEDDALSWLEKP